MKYKEVAYFIIIFLLGFFLFKQCNINKQKEIKIFSEIPKTDTLRFRDTILIPFEKKVYVTKFLEPDKKEITIVNNDTINVFETTINDSLISGKIISNVKGTLINQKLSYKPLFPKEIIIKDSVIIKEPKLYCKKKENFSLGVI